MAHSQTAAPADSPETPWNLFDAIASDLRDEKEQRARPPLDPAELEKLLPAYEVTRLIGVGGMGAVYDVRHRKMGQRRALKILSPHLVDDAASKARFDREIQTLAGLEHENIVRIFTAGESLPDAAGHRFPYLEMEYVEGETLAAALHAGRVPQSRALEIACALCRALDYAHSRQDEQGRRRPIVHRDIKPENVLLTKDGRVLLADFGISRQAGGEAPAEDNDPARDPRETASALPRLTLPGRSPGTPPYAAPEAYAGHTESRSDIYSLGVMLAEMLTGSLPDGPPHEPLHVTHPDPKIDTILTKATHPQMEERYPTAAALQAAVAALSAAGRAVEQSAAALTGAGKANRRTFLRSAAIAASAAAIITAAINLRPAQQPTPPPAPAALPPPPAKPAAPPTPGDPATLEGFRSIIQSYAWRYQDSLYPESTVRFETNGTFHDRWHWHYWIPSPGIMHIQFWEPNYDPATALTFQFNPEATAFTCEFKDERDRLHKITGTRLQLIPR